MAENEEESILRIKEIIKEQEENIENIDFPFLLVNYPTKELAHKSKIEFIKSKNSIEKNVKEYREHKLREDFWHFCIPVLEERLVKNDLDNTTKILLKTSKRESLSIKELNEWNQQSNKISLSQIKKIENFSELNDRIIELKETISKLDIHIEKLKIKEDLERKLRINKEKYENKLKKDCEVAIEIEKKQKRISENNDSTQENKEIGLPSK